MAAPLLDNALSECQEYDTETDKHCCVTVEAHLPLCRLHRGQVFVLGVVLGLCCSAYQAWCCPAASLQASKGLLLHWVNGKIGIGHYLHYLSTPDLQINRADAGCQFQLSSKIFIRNYWTAGILRIIWNFKLTEFRVIEVSQY